MKLSTHRYGKSRVRVMKILREGAGHKIKELTVDIALTGDFESSYTSGDNRKVVATDTIKNTVNILAKDHLGQETELFAAHLASHFLARYEQVGKVGIRTSERVWERLVVAGQPHPHSFSGTQQSRPLTAVDATREKISISSGIADLLILKSTASGFEDYPRCEFTTLPETSDRIFATALEAMWDWQTAPASYAAANELLLQSLLQPFACNYSPSVQTTLFQMGAAALHASPQISRIHLAMPNKHCNLIDLSKFGLENNNEVFVPTDEPHGQIEATISRE